MRLGTIIVLKQVNLVPIHTILQTHVSTLNCILNAANYAVDFGGGLVTGTPVYAPVAGDVISAGWNNEGYGLLIKIREDPAESVAIVDELRVHWLAHLSKIYVNEGHVEQGDLIALSGDTGNGGAHLHYHVQLDDRTPVDVRDELPNINWRDATDYCYGEKLSDIDGTVHPDPIATGIQTDNCADFYDNRLQGVFGFDAPNCQGNIVFGPLMPGEIYDLASMGVNDRLRSVSAESGLHFWLYGNSDNDVLAHCHERHVATGCRYL